MTAWGTQTSQLITGGTNVPPRTQRTETMSSAITQTSNTPRSLHDRLSSKRGESLLGTKCSVDGCQYVVNEETAILNKYKQEIHDLGGKNLYPNRMIPVSMRCCKWWCRNKTTYGHSEYNSNFSGLGNHTCVHAYVYQDAIHERNIESRLPGCTCVMLNEFGEAVETWEPQSRRGVPCPGRPLDLDIKYHERRMQKDGEKEPSSESSGK